MSELDSVAKGMRVIDATGKEIGKVRHIHPPNPKAAAFEEMLAAADQSILFVGLNAVIGVEPRVPEEMARRLFRAGYIKINGEGFWHVNTYAAADVIDRVEAGKVYLNLSRHDLASQE
ncbi:MAG: hypothetical protein M3017_17775 [Actinomycetota bacterium]|nr:hypothetical protein [Actinomycetota bacterium]